jgi:hypothetical protein
MTNLREITFRHDGEDHLVTLSMPDEDEVVIEHKHPGCDPHHKVDGKFLICGNARNYYETKRNRGASALAAARMIAKQATGNEVDA